MKTILFSVLLIFILFGQPLAGDKNKGEISSEIKTIYHLYEDLKILDEPGFFDVEFTSRKIKASILSTIVPGSGQTYLGHELKGMVISLGFYGTFLAAVIAHNNSQGREDRIKVLTQEYNTKSNYADAETVWQSILAEKANRDNDYQRRSLFSWLSIGIWAYNLFDVIFLTDDFGETEFSQNNSQFNINIVSQNDYNGVALKINLP
jgi:hypothetical protein